MWAVDTVGWAGVELELQQVGKSRKRSREELLGWLYAFCMLSVPTAWSRCQGMRAECPRGHSTHSEKWPQMAPNAISPLNAGKAFGARRSQNGSSQGRLSIIAS